MYMRMLVKKGVPVNTKVIEVSNGSEVIAEYKKSIPDIVFLDIHMPGMDGITVLNKLFSMDKEAYVIMLSADSSPENVDFTTKIRRKRVSANPLPERNCGNKSMNAQLFVE